MLGFARDGVERQSHAFRGRGLGGIDDDFRDAKGFMPRRGGQPFRLAAEPHSQSQARRVYEREPEQTQAANLDDAGERGRGAAKTVLHDDLVIRHEPPAACQEAEQKIGLAAARLS
jgi:hypothetical protein